MRNVMVIRVAIAALLFGVALIAGMIWAIQHDTAVAGAVLAAVLLLVSGVLAFDAVSRKSGTGLLLMMGFLVLFIGERVFGEGTMRVPVSGLGLVVVLASVGIRAWAWNRSTGGRKQGHQLA